MALQRGVAAKACRSCMSSGFARGKGKFVITEYVPTDERTGPRFPLLLTTGRIRQPIQCRRADAANREQPPGIPRTFSKSIPMTPSCAACATATGCACKAARARPRCTPKSPTASRPASSTRPSIIRCAQTNVITTDYSDWATNCPEYKVTAVQVSPSNGPSEWQERYREMAENSRRVAVEAPPAAE